MWTTGYDDSTDLYGFIRALNRLRKRERIERASMMLMGVSSDWLVLCRGDPDGPGGCPVWLFANNRVAEHFEQPYEYCPTQLPVEIPGTVWVDELSGQTAWVEDRCLVARDGAPKVFVRQDRPEQTAEGDTLWRGGRERSPHAGSGTQVKYE